MDWLASIPPIITTVVVSVIAFFMKRSITQQDAKTAANEAELKNATAAIRRDFLTETDRLRTDFLAKFGTMEKRMDKLEANHNQLVKDIPFIYASKEDMLRMYGDLKMQNDKIFDKLMEMQRSGK